MNMETRHLHSASWENLAKWVQGLWSPFQFEHGELELHGSMRHSDDTIRAAVDERERRLEVYRDALKERDRCKNNLRYAKKKRELPAICRHTRAYREASEAVKEAKRLSSITQIADEFGISRPVFTKRGKELGLYD